MEGAIHSVCEFFDLHGGNGLEVIFVNAQNGFNSVNHVAALWNTRVP